ncbi:MAG: Fic family protein [Saprospiraceae bacterium]|nr:Fic family protein [Saprospiraceae bacterium]
MKWQELKLDQTKIKDQIQRLEEKKVKLDRFRPIPAFILKSLRDSLCLDWTYHSNGIEGNTLSLRETRMIIEDGLTVGGKSLREHFEALNHNEAIQYIESLLSSDFKMKSIDILETHALVLKNIEQPLSGRYRTAGVRISGANFIPPNASKISTFINELVDWVNENDNQIPDIVRAAVFHHRFVWIHPFFNGNGRTARLLFNLLLMSKGFPPSLILKQDRKKYYDALQRANLGDYSKIILLTSQAAERGLDIYLSQLQDNQDDFKDISLIVMEPGVPYGQEYLSLLARRGKIAAFKDGKNWLMTQAAVMAYMSARKRRRNV